MQTNYQIGVNIDANSARGAARTISVADRALNTFGNTATAFSSSVTSMGAAYGNAVSSFRSGNPYIIAASVAVSGLAVAANQSVEALQRAGTFDASRRGLIAVSENATLAADKLKELENVAADTQGLTFRQAVNAQRNLQTAKIEANEATREIKTFANAVALVGGGEEEFKGVLTALTQIASKSKISAEEINQLAERMPQIRTAIQNVYGTADTEILQKRGIDPKDFLRDITTELEKMPKAQGSVIGGWENLTDAIDKAYIKMGDPALPTATRILDKLAKMVEENGETFTEWGKRIDGVLKTIDNAVTVIDFLGDTSLVKLISYLDQVASYSNILTPTFDALSNLINTLGGDIDAYNKKQAGMTAAAAGSIKGLETGYKQVSKTAKESYDERLKAADNYHKLAVSKTGAGIRASKAQELGYQKELLRVEHQTYAQRLTALQNYYFERFAKSKTFAEREQLIREGKTAKSDLDIDFAVTKQNIQNNIDQVQQAVNAQLRADLTEGLQLRLDEASTTMKNTLEDLSDAFSKGAIAPQEYADKAKKALNDYADTFDRIRREQLDQTLAAPGLTDQQIQNETDKASQALLNSNRETIQTYKKIWDELFVFQSARDRAAANGMIDLKEANDEAGLSYLKFYQIVRDFPDIASDPANSILRSVWKPAAEAKKAFQEVAATAAESEELLLLNRQQASENSLLKRIEYLEKEKEYFKDNKTEQNKIDAEIASFEAKLLVVRAKNYEEFADFKVNKAKEAAQAEIDINQEIADASVSASQSLLNLQNEFAQVTGSNFKKLQVEVATARQEATEIFKFDKERLKIEKTEALKRVKGLQNEADLKSKINEAFRLKELGLERDYQKKLLEINKGLAERERQAKNQDWLDNANPFAKGIFGELGVEKFQSDADQMKAIATDLGAVIGDAFGQMADAVGSAIEGWVLYGDSIGESLQRATAAVLANIAAQSAVKAIYELAEGFALLFVNPAASSAHFTAAAIYGGIAAGSALVGRAIAPKDKGASSSTNQNSPDYQIATGRSAGGLRSTNQNLLTSGSSAQQSDNQIAQALRDLNNRLDSVPPEHVLKLGVKRSGTFITDVTISHVKNSSSKKKDLGTALRLK